MNISREAARRTAFEQLKDESLEILTLPEMEERLGNEFAHIVPAIECSFVLPRKDGVVTIPDEERDSDKIGMHPILTRDVTMPGLRRGDYLHTHDRIKLENEFPIALGRISMSGTKISMGSQRITRNIDPYVPNLLISYTKESNGEKQKEIVIERPLVHIPATLLRQEESRTRAAVIAHEFDHAVRLNKPADYPAVKKSAAGQHDPSNKDELRVLLERTAYELAARVLEGGRQEQANPFLGVVASGSPEGAIANAAEFYRSNMGKMSRHERIHVVAQLAQAFTTVFAAGSELPTEDEKKAYKALNLV